MKSGEYLRQDYIDELLKTLSPLQATRQIDPQLVIVERKGSVLHLIPTYDLHEGGDPYMPLPTGKLLQKKILSGREGITWTEEETSLSLEVKSPKTFLIRNPGQPDMEFHFVGNAEKWLASIVIAGEYRDATGRLYVFDKEGKAQFPEREFKYRLGIDHVLNDYDYISDGEQIYAFRVSKRTLDLYEVSGDNEEIVSLTPKWTLTRVSDRVKEP